MEEKRLLEMQRFEKNPNKFIEWGNQSFSGKNRKRGEGSTRIS